MGAVDLVLQVESPKSVSRGLQRIGRAGHHVGDVSKGRIFPKFRADLLECAVVVEAHARGPDRADRRAAQRARRARPADRRDRGVAPSRTRSASTTSTRSSRARTPTPSCRASCSRTSSTCSTAATRRRSSASCARASCGTASPARSARARARASSRSRTRARSPTAACSPSCCPTAAASASSTRRWSTRRAPARRSCSARRRGGSRTSAATASRSRPRRACRAPCRSGRATASGGRRSSAREIGAFSRWAVDQSAETLEARLRPRPARREEPPRLPRRAAGGDARRPERPHDRRRALPRRDRRLAPVRAQPVRRARARRLGARAVSARIRDVFGLESDAIWSDDGIIVHLPDADEPPGAELVMLEPDEVEDAVVGELSSSALFGARFRENAGRALLIPRAYPGRRTPLWQQRLKSQSLLEVAQRYADFPIILETYRECLRDVLDVPGLVDLLRGLHRRELTMVEVETPTASPFASLAAVRLRRDVHVRGRHAERRAARGRALARPRPAARAARPGGAARPHRPRRARAGRGRPPAPLGPHARGDAPTRCTTSCAGSAT